jgi:hypothetical protein
VVALRPRPEEGAGEREFIIKLLSLVGEQAARWRAENPAAKITAERLNFKRVFARPAARRVR